MFSSAEKMMLMKADTYLMVRAASGGLVHAAQQVGERRGTGSKQICRFSQSVDQLWVYLTFWELSSFDQDRVDGNEGRDEEVVTNAPLSV